jgi:hypothetical protein
MKLEEEIARAILIGDGREESDEAKIPEDHVRPIATDVDPYVIRVKLPADAQTMDIVDNAIIARGEYRGSGNPRFFTSPGLGAQLFIARNSFGERIYRTDAELAASMRVSSIIEVPLFDNVTRDDADGKTYELKGIIVNLRDYTLGADKGGAITSYNDFDLEYNKERYLIETRVSGMLTVPKSAIVIEQEVAAG